jgi:hypothetical protein
LNVASKAYSKLFPGPLCTFCIENTFCLENTFYMKSI